MYKIKTFNTFTNKWEEKTVEIVKDYGETCTDSTHYKPNVNNWESLDVGASNIEGLYDFEDGKDDGDRTLQMLRNPALDQCEKDKIITSAVKAGNNIKENINKTIGDIKAEIEAEAKAEAENINKTE